MVGSANGRSIIELTMRLPGKSSRTSTHAMIVPITTLISATITETNNVTRNDAKATGAVTASQNPEIPSSNAVAVNAASGSRTITESHRVATPIPSGPTLPVTRASFRRRATGVGSIVSVTSVLLGRVVVDHCDRTGCPW